LVMGKENLRREPGEKVMKIKVPDKDMLGWIETLRNGGMSDEQINSVLSYLNRTYAEQKRLPNIDIIDEKLEQLEEYLFKTYGRELSEEQRAYLRKGIESRFKNKK